MISNLRLNSLIPAGLFVESITEDEDVMVVLARAKADQRACPMCGKLSGRIHSRYVRTAADLPCAGKKLVLRLVSRRFFCKAAFCQRGIFAERFDDGIIAERARRTSRLEHIVHHLGLALGGRPAAGFAKRLMMPVSNDTLLRVVRRRAKLPTEPLSIIGIDDWPGGEIIAMGPLFAIWSAGGSWRCCPTGRLQRWKLGSLIIKGSE